MFEGGVPQAQELPFATTPRRPKRGLSLVPAAGASRMCRARNEDPASLRRLGPRIHRFLLAIHRRFDIMLKRLLTMAVAVVAIAGFAQVAHAQYMYLDSNGNGIHDAGDVMQANNTGTTVAVWLDTAHNRNGTASTCDTADGNLTINSYVVNMASAGGNVTYSGFVNDQTTMTVAFGE